ncbi:hypothetical protein JCM8208_002161 [Rhodotorula glutinis]
MATTSANRSHEGHTLPLASFVAQRAPTHPLPRLVTDPVLPRLAQLEAALLTSRPAALLLRLGIASERSIVALALAALAAALARWRAQWRAVLWALGLGEALSRTVRLLQRQAVAVDSERKQHGRGADDGDAEETQHVLSFWLLFAALSLLDTLRSTPSSPSSSALSFLAVPTRARAALQSVRRTYLHFVRLWILPSFLRLRWAGRALVAKYPRLDPAPRLAYWTAFPYAFPRLYPSPSSSSSSSTPARRAAGNFPQPRSRPWDPLPTSLPLSWSYFAYPSTPHTLAHPSLAPTYSPRATAAAEARWELVRLVVLWVALRRDAWGAKSLVWDWTLAPLLGALPGAGPGAPDEPTTVLRVVREVVGPRAKGATAGRSVGARDSSESARPQTSQDDPDVPLSPSGSSSSASATPRRATTAAAGRDYPTPSPYALAWTPPRPAASSSSAASRPRGSAPPSHAWSSRTASPARATSARAPFALQDPPAARAGTSRSGALLGGAARSGRERGAAPSGGGRGLLSPGLSVSGSSSVGGGSRGSGRDDDDDEWDVDAGADDDSDVPPATPGEEEAEEGARRWATVLAEAHAAELLVDVEGSGELVGTAGEGEGHDGEPGWSR